MATNEISADLVVAQFRDAETGGQWLTMVCETTLNGTLVRTTNEVLTKCGTIVSNNPMVATMAGSGAANTAPTATQVSLKQAIAWIDADTLLEARLVNLDDGADVDLGEAILIKGDGRFTSVNPSADAGQSLTFDWAFNFTGTLDFDETDES